ALIILPMSLLMFFSNFFLNNQIRTEEQKYLNSSLEIVFSDMQKKSSDMLTLCHFFAEDEHIKDYLQQKNSPQLNNNLKRFKNYYHKNIDYAIIVDNKNTLLAYVSPNVRYAKNSKIGVLAEKAIQENKTIQTTDIISLDELFPTTSKEYNAYSVKLDEKIAGQNQYLRKALVDFTIVPIKEKNNPANVSGALIVADIANGECYFPEYISSRATEGFLVLSIDGIRIATKATEGEEIPYLIGTKATKGKIFDNKDGQFFGTTSIKGTNYIFLDREIKNINGAVVGYLSIGIEESRFASMVTDNRTIALAVIFICLIIMLIFGHVLAENISAPIVAVTQMVKKYGQKYLGTAPCRPTATNDESVILLESFQEFISNLKKAEEERTVYLKQLEEEHAKQKQLSETLKETNDNLELLVTERTQHLQAVVAELKKLDVTKSQFLANLSHELRTPLSVIINAADILSGNYFGELSEKQNKYLHSISYCGNHLLQLINDLLDISKLASGKMTLKKQEFYIAALVTEVVKNVQNLIKNKDLEISVDIEPEDFLIYADLQRITQIFYNLLSNAIKFTDSGGKVNIKIFNRGDKMEVIIQDTGIGIAEEDQKRIFCEFEQVESNYDKRFGGTGLGLPIVKKLVELHDGQIFLKSKLGEGTEIIFAIPLTKVKA
ncbi:MAG: ATP-binding protein, partial [Acidaminococcaceae bacterium]